MDMYSRMVAENFCSQLNDDWVLNEKNKQAEKETKEKENN